MLVLTLKRGEEIVICDAWDIELGSIVVCAPHHGNYRRGFKFQPQFKITRRRKERGAIERNSNAQTTHLD